MAPLPENSSRPDGPAGARSRFGLPSLPTPPARAPLPHAAIRAGIFALCCVVFGVDLLIPRGVAVGAFYAPILLATAWLRRPRYTLGVALIQTVLVIAGWVFSPSFEVNGVLLVDRGVIVNRGVSLLLLWLCCAFILSRLMASDRFRTAVDAAPAGMLVIDGRGRVRSANEAAGVLLGTPCKDLRKTPLSRYVSVGGGRERIDLGHCFSDRAAANRFGVRHLKVRREDGTPFQAEVSLRRMQTELEPMLLLTLRDLTEEQHQEEVNERLATIVRSSPDAIFRKDLDGTITDWNPGAEAIYGYSAEEIVGQSVAILFPSEQLDEVEEILAGVRAGRDDLKLSTKRRCKDGRVIDVDVSVTPIRDRAGTVIGASTIARDVSAERGAERLMRELNLALRLAMPGIATVSAEGLIETANDGIAEFGSRSASELLGRSWLDLLDRDEAEAAERAFEEMLRDGRSELVARARGDEERFVELFLVRRLDSDSRFVGCHLFLRDVTERVVADRQIRRLAGGLAKANRKLERLAHVDPLTGLLNRRGLQRHLRRLQAERTKLTPSTAVVFVDVDDFKDINGEHGHAVGDRVLAAVARCLEGNARPTDATARVGGDEFLLVLPETTLSQATRVAERMRASIGDARIEGRDGPVEATCSFGVSLLPPGASTIEQLIEAAREEFSASKAAGKNRVSASTASVAPDPLHELLAGEELRAVQHPILDLLEERVVAFELLTRGPDGPYRSPDALFDLAGPGEDLARLDLACLRVCVAASRSLPETTSVHCNLYPATLLHYGADRILEELAGVGPNRVCCIELNERNLPGDSTELVENVRALKAHGIQIAIDDVGFGATSLEALIHLEPDIIKLDRSCVGCDRRSLERLLDVAHVLRARVIAEGVEDEAALANLRELRIRFAQGFLWGEPAPVEPLADHVLEPRPRRAAGRADEPVSPLRPEFGETSAAD